VKFLSLKESRHVDSLFARPTLRTKKSASRSKYKRNRFLKIPGISRPHIVNFFVENFWGREGDRGRCLSRESVAVA
jgi:hypothetical protein